MAQCNGVMRSFHAIDTIICCLAIITKSKVYIAIRVSDGDKNHKIEGALVIGELQGTALKMT